MSKQLSKTRLYTEAEFKAASRIERIGISLQQKGLMLAPTDEQYKNDLWKVFQIYCESMSQIAVIRKVQDLFPSKKLGTIRNMIADAESVFGDLIKRNKDLSRAVRIDMAMKLYEIALHGKTKKIKVTMPDAEGEMKEVEVDQVIHPPDLKQAGEMIKLIDKIESEIKDEQKLLEDLELGDIIFTTDPAALAEDIDHEEVE